MNLTQQNKTTIIVIAILVAILIILYMCSSVMEKNNELNNNMTDCSCSIQPFESTQKDRLCLYYTNWCGYSKQFLPEWEKLKEKIMSSDLKNKIKLEDYECDQNKQICEQANIKGFPSVVLYKTNGGKVNYNGERTVDALLQFYANESHN